MLTYVLESRRDGKPRLLAYCPRCGNDPEVGSSLYARFLASLGTFGLAPEQVIADAPNWTPTRKAPAACPVPSDEEVQGWHEALMASARPRKHLQRVRMLDKQTLRRYEVGFADPAYHYGQVPAFVFPVRGADGSLTNVKQRAWGAGRWRFGERGEKALSLPASGAQFYPYDQLEHDNLVLCEGEPDTLLLVQHGFHAVTSTAGTSLPEGWETTLAGKTVTILYDVGVDHVAERNLGKLRATGIEARWAPWPDWMHKREDVGDWFFKYRRSADELRRLVRLAVAP